MRRHLALAIALVGAAACADGETADGVRIFQRCYACHSLSGGDRLSGPTLRGVFGRHAGTLNDFEYSPAMREAGRRGLVWTAETLDRFLEDPEERFRACGWAACGCATRTSAGPSSGGWSARQSEPGGYAKKTGRPACGRAPVYGSLILLDRTLASVPVSLRYAPASSPRIRAGTAVAGVPVGREPPQVGDDLGKDFQGPIHVLVGVVPAQRQAHRAVDGGKGHAHGTQDVGRLQGPRGAGRPDEAQMPCALS